MREALIYAQTPDLVLLAGWMFVGIILSLAGIRLIYREENSYVKVI